VLFNLPFAILRRDSSQPYLVENFELSYAPSLNILVLCSDAAKNHQSVAQESVLSVGNPYFNRESYPDLPDLASAGEEAKVIRSNYATGTCLLGKDAIRRTVESEMTRADVVHFACHYLVDVASPLRSQLVLAKSPENEDGALSAAQVSRLRLQRPRLIVLSACQTGVERYYGGEGMIGMARTFLAARVPLVVASQWPVDSDATADLMIKFHEYRKQKGLTTTAALRQAQLDMLQAPERRYHDPYYWAAFAPIGGYAQF
jgi:CHAT domain-containing protein